MREWIGHCQRTCISDNLEQVFSMNGFIQSKNENVTHLWYYRQLYMEKTRMANISEGGGGSRSSPQAFQHATVASVMGRTYFSHFCFEIELNHIKGPLKLYSKQSSPNYYTCTCIVNLFHHTISKHHWQRRFLTKERLLRIYKIIWFQNWFWVIALTSKIIDHSTRGDICKMNYNPRIR